MGKHNADVLIVGAGMSGLMAAHILQRKGVSVTLADKGRSVGGRLATRRIGRGRADHGAQFFTVRTAEFQVWVDDWLTDGLVYEWSRGWSDGSLSSTKPDGHPRYAVRSGMQALAKHLAQGLDIQINSRLSYVTLEDRWQAEDENGRRFISCALLLTAPVPQSLALLDAGGVRLAAADRAALERIRYGPCLAGLFWVDGPVHLPAPGALQRPDEAISWIADNKRKGISPGATLITVHAGSAYSEKLWETTDAEVLEALQFGLKPFLNPSAEIVQTQLKRWRYAQPTALHPERYIATKDLSPLAFAGDAFGCPRVEGAALSGIAAANAIYKAAQIRFDSRQEKPCGTAN
jgi:predicted NAD/FAD-dependent oxidoreductase